MKRRMSQGQAMRSTLAFSRVTHFITPPSPRWFAYRVSAWASSADLKPLVSSWAGPLAPGAVEVERRLLANHMVVERNDGEPGLAERPEDGLDLASGHDEVPVDRRSDMRRPIRVRPRLGSDMRMTSVD